MFKVNFYLSFDIFPGLSLKPTVAEKLQETLGEKLTPEISTLLGKLTSGELTPAPLERKPPQYTPAERMTIPQLERLIENLTQKNVDTISHKKQLLMLYIREKDLLKSESLLKELEGQDVIRSSNVYAMLLDVSVRFFYIQCSNNVCFIL